MSGARAPLPRIDRNARAHLLLSAGAVLAPLVGWEFALAYLGLWGIFTAYETFIPDVGVEQAPFVIVGTVMAMPTIPIAVGASLSW